MLFGLAHEFQEAPWHQLSGPAWRGRLGSRSQRPARSDRAQKLLEALPDKDGENPVNVQPRTPSTWTSPACTTGSSQSHAGARADGNKKDKKRMTVALTVNATGTQQLKPIIIHTAQKPRAFPKNFKVESALNVHWYFNKTAWMLSTVFQDWLRKVCLHSTS
jgi:hypothetical protein